MGSAVDVRLDERAGQRVGLCGQRPDFVLAIRSTGRHLVRDVARWAGARVMGAKRRRDVGGGGGRQGRSGGGSERGRRKRRRGKAARERRGVRSSAATGSSNRWRHSAAVDHCIEHQPREKRDRGADATALRLPPAAAVPTEVAAAPPDAVAASRLPRRAGDGRDLATAGRTGVRFLLSPRTDLPRVTFLGVVRTAGGASA
eukprot:ctg_1930.g408